MTRTSRTDQAAEAQLERLRAAVERGGELFRRVPVDEAPQMEIETAPAAKPARGRFRWPFSRKPDPQAARTAEMLASLEASILGRPMAADRMRVRLARSETAGGAEETRAAG